MECFLKTSISTEDMIYDGYSKEMGHVVFRLVTHWFYAKNMESLNESYTSRIRNGDFFQIMESVSMESWNEVFDSYNIIFSVMIWKGNRFNNFEINDTKGY